MAPLIKPDKCITRLNGSTGVMGIKGDKGDEGSRGSSGPPGIKGVKGEQGSKGEKGEIVNSAVSQTNWKQCVWKRMIVEIVERSKKGNINKISNLFPVSPL